MPRQKATLPAQESFHAQHAPFGAFSSFTIGLVGSPGGFGHALRGPARQNVYIGFRTGGRSKWRLLPFFQPPQWDASAFTGEAASPEPSKSIRAMEPKEYERALGWASDTWRAGDGRFGFSLLTPFGEVPDPRGLRKAEARERLSPHLNAWIEFDNRAGKSVVELIFGVGDSDRLFRPLRDADERLLGFAANGDFGYATEPSSGAEARQGFDVFEPKFRDYRGLHVIGGETALVFRVPAGEQRRFPLALGFYQQGVITSGIKSSYAYARCFDDLEDVLRFGLDNRDRCEALAGARDAELEASKLDADQRFLLAQATRSYFGSTQLMWAKGAPLWIVNEGEYRMMNTFDLTVDHVFFELRYFPWAVRDTLDLFVSRYAYKDRTLGVDGQEAKGGISFAHDMGVLHAFTPPGRSSYECDGLRGCFSHMTMEQLLNWVLAAVCYAEKTGDGAWLRRRGKTLLACAKSLRRRDAAKAAERDGLLKRDSARCGLEGAEITTYDSLDVSLGQARSNLYLGVKTLAAWILLERAFAQLGLAKDAGKAGDAASLLAGTLASKFDVDRGSFPAVFEAGNESRIIPAIEGWVYPLYLNLGDALDRGGRFGALLGLLETHLSNAMRPGVCLDATSGGWKMSSSSTNTWFSKIALCQHVARRLFPAALGPEALAADRAHADWQRQPGCGAFAMVDQIRSDSGLACGSRYYPRGVTAILWLDE